MDDQNAFLKYIYHEDIYILDEPTEHLVEEEHKPEATEPANVPEAAKEAVPVVDELVAKQEPVSVVEEPKPVTFFGNNEKGILFLVNDLDNDLLNQQDLDLFMKIIESGLKYSKNDFALVNVAKFPLNQILDEVGYSYLVSFGVDLSDYYSGLSAYTIHTIDENSVLLSDELAALQDDTSKKGKLWLALKSMFNI